MNCGKVRALSLLLSLSSVLSVSAAVSPVVSRFKEFVHQADYLGARIFLKNNFSKLKTADDWLALRAAAIKSADFVGFDLVYAMDSRPVVGLFSGPLDINSSRTRADRLMIEGKFVEAFKIYQQIAIELKKQRGLISRSDEKVAIDFLMPFVFQAMGRALYGAGRFDEAYIVYRWVPQSFPRIREIQFEKMWAAFRGGRVDHALGAIASQSSAYFNSYLNPESYLVQTYLYKKLCRTEDYSRVLEQMRAYLKDLKSGKYGVSDFARSDLEILVMWNLLSAEVKNSSVGGVTANDRDSEKKRINKILLKAFEKQKRRLIDDLEKASAYVQLTVRSGDSGVLKPIAKLPDRQSLYEMGLAIWPADSKEDWIDEIGTHRFVGESLCGREK